MVITAIIFMALWDWLLCLCLGELKLSSPQVDFCVYSAWTEWQSPALDRTTCLHHCSASSRLACSFWPSRWYSILQKLSSVSVFSLSLQLLKWNFRKCQIQPGPVWLTRMPSPHHRGVQELVATPQQRSLRRAREPMVQLILNLS